MTQNEVFWAVCSKDSHVQRTRQWLYIHFFPPFAHSSADACVYLTCVCPVVCSFDSGHPQPYRVGALPHCTEPVLLVPLIWFRMQLKVHWVTRLVHGYWFTCRSHWLEWCIMHCFVSAGMTMTRCNNQHSKKKKMNECLVSSHLGHSYFEQPLGTLYVASRTKDENDSISINLNGQIINVLYLKRKGGKQNDNMHSRRIQTWLSKSWKMYRMEVRVDFDLNNRTKRGKKREEGI